MGQSAAATVDEIKVIRDRLESNFEELERRMPSSAVRVKRIAGIAVGGGLGAIVLRQVVKRVAKKRSKTEQVKSAVLAAGPTQMVVQLLPDDVAEKIGDAFEDGRWKQWAAAGAGVWLALKLVELRQLRRVNRSLVTGRS